MDDENRILTKEEFEKMNWEDSENERDDYEQALKDILWASNVQQMVDIASKVLRKYQK